MSPDHGHVAVPTALECSSGEVRHLAVDRWHADASAVDRAALDDLRGPTLDVGCGPGRLVQLLAERGVAALGVDTSPAALRAARHRGASVLERSVFDPLPAEGRWADVLLLDGNIGIGGDPARLLARIADLLEPGGRAVVEVEPPGADLHREAVRLLHEGRRSAWFPWAWVGADAVDEVAARAGLTSDGAVALADRWFARLGKPGAGPRRGTAGRGTGSPHGSSPLT